MNILIIAPKVQSEYSGNNATAKRWKSLLEENGYEVEISSNYIEQNADILIAIHLRRSHKSISTFKKKHPDKPLISVVAGTDLYSDLANPQHEDTVKKSIELSDTLVVLQNKAKKLLQNYTKKRIEIVYPSTDKELYPVDKTVKKDNSIFKISVIGHPREVKDSLRSAYAARELPEESKVKIFLIGKSIDSKMESLIEKEIISNQRFLWLREQDRASTWQHMHSSNLMVLSSINEGGATVIAEACSIGLPILATRVSGNLGFLGEDYSGYFETKNTKMLRNLILKCENDSSFLNLLKKQVESKSYLFTKEQEKSTLHQIIKRQKKVGLGNNA